MSERHDAIEDLDERPQRRSEEPTAPFLLERSSAEAEVPKSPHENTEETPEKAKEKAKEKTTETLESAESTSDAETARGQRDVLSMARRLGVIALVNASLYLAIAVFGAIRYLRDSSAIPEVVLAIITGGLALWGSLSGYHLLQASRARPDAGHQLAGAFSNFRSIFILKGTGLFLILALSCFVFSAALSLAVLL